MKRFIVGNIERVDYSKVCDMIVSSVVISKRERRLKEVVKDLGIYLNKNLDDVRIKSMLERRGNLVERRFLVGEVLRVEDWVVS